jgi:hypothetical protein
MSSFENVTNYKVAKSQILVVYLSTAASIQTGGFVTALSRMKTS